MKCISTLLIISFFTFSLFAQVTIDPEVIIMESGGYDVVDVKYTITKIRMSLQSCTGCLKKEKIFHRNGV